ncbi:AfsR/SARP family transcriptional regulator [Amycolatopsis samaneae]|uniref:BTAD domain-containing putative transcriptional regulator n=1 Tax=Amycolatopsis samaneae TaxID=664691 RepID=A0ABW5GP47_9PSEU
MEFRILGPIEVCSADGEIDLDGAKQRTMLAALLLADGRVLSDAQLSELLWGENPPATVNAQIYTYVSRLRKRLGDSAEFVRRAPGYLMKYERGEFDYHRFEAKVRVGREALDDQRFAEASTNLRAALACWRGPALSDATEFLVEAHRYRLEEARLAALDARIEADLQLDRQGELVPELTGLVAAHPLREHFRAQLMIALHRTDRQADALATFHEGRRILADQLGCDPGHDLTSAYRDVLADSPVPAQRSRPVVVAPMTPFRPGPAMLPAEAPVLCGREAELAAIDRLLTADRRVSLDHGRFPVLTGMAGVGKTALAVHAARELAPQYPDGQLYADLGGALSDPVEPAIVLHGFLRALGVGEAAIPESLSERIRLYWRELAGRRLLVVLDNAETEEQVHVLLPRGTQCRAIVTARPRMAALDGGVLIEVPLLPEDRCLEMLGAIIGADRVTEEPDAATRIVRLCGGLPLAVSIMGARLARRWHWSLGRMAARLSYRHRLDELQTGILDVRGGVRKGYARLDTREQLAFRRLALLNVPDFPCWAVAVVLGVPYAAGEEVAERLVDERLIEVSGDSSWPPRFRFHELVKLAGRELASEMDIAEERRAAFGRALDAWMLLADAARDNTGYGEWGPKVVGLPSCEVAASPASWFEAERGALRALARQAATLGLGTVAGKLSRAISELEVAVGLPPGSGLCLRPVDA